MKILIWSGANTIYACEVSGQSIVHIISRGVPIEHVSIDSDHAHVWTAKPLARIDYETRKGLPDSLWLLDAEFVADHPEPYKLIGDRSVTVWTAAEGKTEK